MYYGNIKRYDIADGTGVRVSLFVSGCRRHCKGCFNQATWDFKYGEPYTKQTEDSLLNDLKSPFIEGITILGGDPFEPENQEEVYNLLKRVKEECPDKTVWVYSGYVFDKDILPDGGMVHTKYTTDILKMIDILVDGPFMINLHKITLNFRGSSNQRIIRCKESLEAKEVILDKLNN